ncbi:hypothetical protein K493DRAFT_86937 [Basidiobolus meristosporus CBS 931.73]|uniref:Uncharacterized protein n=1 Tax=Basidiobolus meristosporus CBS 931.73 TaxID=1314790 RepID=A0A1Y1XFY8_9FUNG|nr:hypothetical protein K493DRAFT_86937 [Basidiobolus meristosporus CBS 931.73]|eukprot:ORX84633.1 hypothetical protein K493DRAFT_86937 [Basidiobolus meristosporus CBS 931.73]
MVCPKFLVFKKLPFPKLNAKSYSNYGNEKFAKLNSTSTLPLPSEKLMQTNDIQDEFSWIFDRPGLQRYQKQDVELTEEKEMEIELAGLAALLNRGRSRRFHCQEFSALS